MAEGCAATREASRGLAAASKRPRSASGGWFLICLLHLVAGCGQAEVPELGAAASDAQDVGLEVDLSFGMTLGAALPAGQIGPFEKVSGAVDVKVVWSKFSHAELASFRVVADEFDYDFTQHYSSPWDENADFRYHLQGTDMHAFHFGPFQCCKFGKIDAEGLGYSTTPNPWAPDVWVSGIDVLMLLDWSAIPNPASQGIHSQAEVWDHSVDILVQAYSREGVPFRPRRYCYSKERQHYVFTTMSPGELPDVLDSALINHSFALPMRHAVPGTFPGCPDDVTATCGDDDCVWPEDEVNCLRDCHWVADP